MGNTKFPLVTDAAIDFVTPPSERLPDDIIYRVGLAPTMEVKLVFDSVSP
jgi:hypothetical protein